MKLWLLRPVGYKPKADPFDGVDASEIDQAWLDPWDTTLGLVIRAETENEARQIAQQAALDFGSGEAYLTSEETVPAWLSAEHSTCTELTLDGAAGIVILDHLAS